MKTFQSYLTFGSLSLLGFSVAEAQVPRTDYFQQRVDYQIAVSLDDSLHRLHGHCRMHYHNQSPDTLRSLYIHLWPNAYKGPGTALARQMTGNGNKAFVFQRQEDKGWIDSLTFRVGAEVQNWRYDPQHPDIAFVQLSRPLAPGDSLWLETPFRVQLPNTISRLGHEGQSYQITQWYPKPAVYDRNGWHPMPYLDNGEFFSEFGRFEVKIQTPPGYVIAATGEKDPNTGAYVADRVHDFAWFADKRYLVKSQLCSLPSGRVIPVYAYYRPDVETDLWEEAPLYLARSVRFYSEIVGEYPYPQATAVFGALKAGGGMEYPMITVIGLSGSDYALDNVITHEIGHNWFYGILASNEREYAWMDEGMNTYIEQRYMRKFYPNVREQNLDQLALQYQFRRGEGQAIETSSGELTFLNYWSSAYGKPALSFHYLERYLGREKMDSLLKRYFDRWQFKHPYPEDLQAIFEEGTGLSLDWFFQQWYQTTKLADYRILSAKPEALRIQNKGQLGIPFPIALVDASGKVLQEVWLPAVAPGTTQVFKPSFDSSAWAAAKALEIDPDYLLPEAWRSNNRYQLQGVFRRGQKLKVNLGFSLKGMDRPQLNLLPVIGGNAYDGLFLGLAAYNVSLPARRWEYSVLPLYGFRSQAPIGMGSLSYHHYNNDFNKIQRWSIGVNLRSFHRRNLLDSLNERVSLRYTRAMLWTEFVLPRGRARNTTEQVLRWESILFGEEAGEYSQGNLMGKIQSQRHTHRLLYRLDNRRLVNPWKLNAGVEYAQYPDFFQNNTRFVKIWAEGQWQLDYNKHDAFYIRAFAGAFPWHENRDFGAMPLQLLGRNFTDYQYDQLWFARSAQQGFGSQQIALAEGGFKTVLPNAVDDGNSNAFLLALNLKSDLPIRLPWKLGMRLRPYVDLAYSHNTAPSVVVNSLSERIYWNGGLGLEVLDGVVGLYLPLVGSSNIQMPLRSRGNVFERLSFVVNFPLLNPLQLVKRDVSTFLGL